MTDNKPIFAEGIQAQTPQKNDGEQAARNRVRGFAGPPQEVATGEVRAAKNGSLRAGAIGSCIVVALYDAPARIGGLAHVMLPGEAPQQKTHQTRYADNGIRELVRQMTDIGARPERLHACIAGGGNVLKRPDETLCEANIASAVCTLERMSILLNAKDVGGTKRRSLNIDIDAGCVLMTVGDGAAKVLWDFGIRKDESE